MPTLQSFSLQPTISKHGSQAAHCLVSVTVHSGDRFWHLKEMCLCQLQVGELQKELQEFRDAHAAEVAVLSMAVRHAMDLMRQVEDTERLKAHDALAEVRKFSDHPMSTEWF